MRALLPQTFDLTSLVRATVAEGVTQSEITTMDNCGMLWFWRYGMLLRKLGSFSWALTYGTALHSTLEQMYSTQGKRWAPVDFIIPPDVPMSGERQKERDYWTGVLDVQSRCYHRHYRDDFDGFRIEEVECVLDHTLPNGIRLMGKMDMSFTLTSDGLWMMDHKTTGRLDLKTVLGWDFRFQFMFYIWLATLQMGSKFQGYYINAIKKPTIKVKQKETLAEYLVRLENEMCMEPEKYYYRERLLVNKESLEYFEHHVLAPKLYRIALLTNPEVSDTIKLSIINNMNTDYCQRYGGACEFLPLCQHGYDMESFQYEVRDVKHVELEEGAE